MRCEATDPYSRVSLRCIRDVGHEPPHLDAFGDDFGVDDQEPSVQEPERTDGSVGT